MTATQEGFPGGWVLRDQGEGTSRTSSGCREAMPGEKGVVEWVLKLGCTIFGMYINYADSRASSPDSI